MTVANLPQAPLSDNSAVARWAELVVAAADAREDPHVLALWARQIHMSVGALRQLCSAAGMAPKRSLDLARLIRAIVWLDGQAWQPEAVLTFRDPRTMRRLFSRIGCGEGTSRLDLEEMLARQTTLERGGAHELALRRVLGKKHGRNSGVHG